MRVFAGKGIAGATTVAALLLWSVLHDHQGARGLERNNAVLRAQLENTSTTIEATDAQPDQMQNQPATQEVLARSGSEPADASRSELNRLRAAVEASRQQTNQVAALRAETRQLRAALHNGGVIPSAAASNGSSSAIEIVEARYGTANTNVDVAEELIARIRGDSLKAVASNNLKGDPEFGKPKRLTLVYRLGGATFTNEFTEGDVILLPRPADAN